MMKSRIQIVCLKFIYFLLDKLCVPELSVSKKSLLRQNFKGGFDIAWQQLYPNASLGLNEHQVIRILMHEPQVKSATIPFAIVFPTVGQTQFLRWHP